MSFRSWFANLQVARTFDRLQQEWRRSPRRRRASYSCAPAEVLEVRSLLSSYTAASVSALVGDINAANANGGTNTITLAANTTFDLTAVNNTTNGANGLPVISGKNGADNLTIFGNGATIDRSTAAGTPAFRLFDVASGNSLTLHNVTLQGGKTLGFFGAAAGGAIDNQGTLVLSNVMVQNNAALGVPGRGQDAAGGGIWSNGSLTLENSTVFQANSAVGSNEPPISSKNGGSAFGGAICIAGGTASITGSFFGAYNQLHGNFAEGGVGGAGGRDGSAYGGAIYVAGGTVTLNADTVGNQGSYGDSSNVAQGPSLSPTGRGYGGGLYMAGGNVTLTNDSIRFNVAGGYFGGGVAWGGGYGSFGYGGGIFVAPGATVYLDSFTAANTYGNIANWYANIDGKYILRN
jgi:hypothetical protein